MPCDADWSFTIRARTLPKTSRNSAPCAPNSSFARSQGSPSSGGGIRELGGAHGELATAGGALGACDAAPAGGADGMSAGGADGMSAGGADDDVSADEASATRRAIRYATA